MTQPSLFCLVCGFRRLRIAWRFKVWPWRVPIGVVNYLSLDPITEADIKRAHELAKRFGWK